MSTVAQSEREPSQVAIACQELAALVAQSIDGKGNGIHQTAIPQLAFMQESTAMTEICDVTEPTLAIVIQGEKEVLLGEETYQYSEAQYLVVSVDLPLKAFVLKATSDRPYLGLKLDLNPTQLCDIIDQSQLHTGKLETSTRGLFVSDANTSLIECATRLTKLLHTPGDIPFLAPLIVREMYYRLLLGEQSEAVRQVATSGSSMQRIAAAIGQIKANFTTSLRVEKLAKKASMSSASFYRHFKRVTSMSPLQYQKQLRLLEARRLMLSERTSAANAAYRVGYESPSQFSREYSRMFGKSPIRDIERLRIV